MPRRDSPRRIWPLGHLAIWKWCDEGMLTLGTRLGVYETIAAIGKGGMGQVYCARDTKLDRDVAIKILPEAFAHDADRLARFTREAKTLASPNHPQMAAIYGLEEGAGASALVMELVEGPTLQDTIAGAGPSAPGSGQSPRSRAQGLPLDDALPMARQIAEALEAATSRALCTAT